MIFDALIVGFGPVGATLANLMLRRGLSVAVVEAATEVYDKPRAITHDQEVMRIWQACGLARQIEAFTAPHPGTRYLGVDGGVIKHFDPAPPPHQLAWTPTGCFLQPEVERVLRAGVTRDPGAEVHLGHLAQEFEDDGEGVTLKALDLAAGTERSLRARYLLACDGANSTVRKRLGIGIEDLAFDEWWMVVDACVTGALSLPSTCIQYCWPSRPATYIQGPGDLRRWEIKLLPGEDPQQFGHAQNVTRQLARFVDTAHLDIWRAAVYRFHALVAQDWRRSRVFLLGDACHQTPPFMGQGLCAGIRDAANLAWKLDAVLRADAPDRLLDSYETERKPHVRTLVATAKAFGEIIGELDPERARLRDQRLRAELERGEAQTVRQRFIPGLTGGVVDTAPDAVGAGSLFIQPWVRPAGGADQRLEDLLPQHFLIASDDDGVLTALSPEARALWRRLGGECVVIAARFGAVEASADCRVLVERDGLFGQWLRQHGAVAAVARPDRYVYGMARDAGALERIIEAVAAQVLS